MQINKITHDEFLAAKERDSKLTHAKRMVLHASDGQCFSVEFDTDRDSRIFYQTALKARKYLALSKIQICRKGNNVLIGKAAE